MNKHQPIDVDVHAEFLNALTRAWAYFDAEHQLLELFFECRFALPSQWFHESLRIGVTDFSGYQLEMVDVHWTDLSGNVIRAEARIFPAHVPPQPAERVAQIGDFVLYAGDYERVLPNLLALPHVPKADAWDEQLLL